MKFLDGRPAGRAANVLEEIRRADDLDDSWPVADLVDALHLPTVTGNALKRHFESTGNSTASLRTLSIHALRDRVLGAHGRVDGVVFNSIARPMARIDDSLASWNESMRLNATGCFAFVRAFGDTMQARGRGSIVAISSIQGMVGMNPWLYEGTGANVPPDYFFHKAGMINLARYLASYYGASGVRVNTVAPGGIHRPDRPMPAAFVERYAKMTMLGRLAHAHEICGAVIFLLSDAASYVTGSNLVVDGGYTAK